MPTLNVPLPTKGLVIDRPGEFIDSRAHASNQNIRVKRNVVESRPGTATVGSSLGERVQRIFEFETEDGDTHLIRVGLTKVEKLNKAAETWSSIANSALNGTSDAQVDYSSVILSGARIVVYTNENDNIRKYTGSGNDAELGGSPPQAKFVEGFGPYLVIANITDDGSGNSFPYRVQWPDTGDPENWSTGNANNTNLLLDRGDITGLKTWGNFLTVHKPDSIYVGQLVSTSSVFRFDRKPTGVGAVSNKAIVTLPTGEQLFLATDGIHLFNGITAPIIPSGFQDELRDDMNSSDLHKADAILKEEDDEAWVAIPIGSSIEPTTIYKYNYRTGQVYKDNRSNLTTFGLYLSTDEKTWDDSVGTWDEQTARWNDRFLTSNHPLVLFGDSSGNTLNETTGSDDNGTAVESKFQTKDFTAQDFGNNDFGRFVRWIKMEIWAKGTDMTVEYSIDSGTSWTSISNVSLESAYPTDDTPDILYFDVFSTKIRFRFSKDGTGESFTLKKYSLEGTVRERRD